MTASQLPTRSAGTQNDSTLSMPAVTGRRPLARAASGVAAGATALLLAASLASPAQAAPAQASPAPAAAHTASGTATSSASSTPRATLWAWANGRRVTAPTVQLSSAKVTSAASHGERMNMNCNPDWNLTDVLSNGRLLGLSHDGTAKITSGASVRPLFKGKLKLSQLWADGKTAYGLTASNVLYRATAAGTRPVKIATLKGSEDTVHPAISGGRVYWTQGQKAGSRTSSRVVSVSLKGGAVRVEAKNARNPQAIDGGVLVSTTRSAKVVPGMLPITGLATIKGGKTTPLLRFTPGALIPADGLDYSIVASGRTVSIANGDKAGTLVIDLRSHRAWNLAAPKGLTGYGQAVSGSTVSYTPFNAGAHLNWTPRLKRVYSFDSATGRLSALGTWAPTMQVVANGRYVAWQDADHDGYPFAVSYRR